MKNTATHSHSRVPVWKGLLFKKILLPVGSIFFDLTFSFFFSLVYSSLRTHTALIISVVFVNAYILRKPGYKYCRCNFSRLLAYQDSR